MQPNGPSPSLADTGHTAEELLDALRHGSLDSDEIAAAVVYAREIEAGVVAVLERARTQELDEPSALLLFRGLHILAAARLTAAYLPFVALLRADESRLDALLGGVITEGLSPILAGLFNGDAGPLFGLAADAKANEFVRGAVLGAIAFLAFDKRVDDAEVRQFLIRFDAERMAPPGDFAWHAWMTAIGLLGLEALAGRVRAGFADRRIDRRIAEESFFDSLLARALRDPTDPTPFEDENLVYIEDAIAVLHRWEHTDAQADVFDTDASTRTPDFEWHAPVRNPWRRVGHNDPCPCGSGRKFKKCCLPTD